MFSLQSAPVAPMLTCTEASPKPDLRCIRPKVATQLVGPAHSAAIAIARALQSETVQVECRLMKENMQGQGEAPVERYAVLHEGKKVATVSVVGEGDDLEFRVNAQTAEVLEQLRSVLARDKAKTGETKTDEAKTDGEQAPAAEPKKRQPTRAEIVHAVIKKIEGLGFGVQQLPSGDVQIRMEISLETGRRVGASSLLHEFAEPRGIDRRIFDALVNVGSSARATMAQKITDGLAAGNAEAAAQALIEWAGVGPIFGVTKVELEEARRVPVEALQAPLREEVLSIRLALAGRLDDLDEQTQNELRALIDEFGGSMEVAKRAELAGFEGAVARAKGYKATAIRHWKAAALNGKDSTRGRALFDLSRAYPTNDFEAARYAELAADAMLQAGDHAKAARCLQRLAACLLVRDPKQAVESIDRALELLGANLLDRDWKGGLLHYKALALESWDGRKLRSTRLRRPQTNVST